MKKPWYLIVLLVLFLLGSIFSIITYSVGSAAIQQAMPNLPSWYIMVALVTSAVELIAIIMIWTWKITGFYLVVGITIINALMLFVYQGSSSFGSIVLGVLGLALLYLVMKPVWKNFK